MWMEGCNFLYNWIEKCMILIIKNVISDILNELNPQGISIAICMSGACEPYKVRIREHFRIEYTKFPEILICFIEFPSILLEGKISSNQNERNHYEKYYPVFHS